MKILILGSSGFIGQNLVKNFQERINAYVIGYDLKPAEFVTPDRMVIGDIRDTKHIVDIIFQDKPEIVLNLAAISTIQGGIEDVEHTWQINFCAVRDLLHSLEQMYFWFDGIPVFIQASTDKVYGELIKNTEGYLETDGYNALHTSPYDVSKAATDELLSRYVKENKVKVFILRFCNIYGPYDRSCSRIFPKTICELLSKENAKIILYQWKDKNGNFQNYYRDFLYVEDLAEGISCLIKKKIKNQKNIQSDIYNLGCGECNCMEDVLNKIFGHIDIPVNFECVITEIPQIKMQYMNCNKAKESFGFHPLTSLDEGINKTIDWWRSITV